jgi:hypothetical protein
MGVAKTKRVPAIGWLAAATISVGEFKGILYDFNIRVIVPQTDSDNIKSGFRLHLFSPF